ncbi:MAG: arginine--tRNA ligase [Candidatus Thermoplasmatota archaeon]|nr:arginine--tRNA ligase [Candidatus Thermoplasmatota archaeon]
MMSMDLSDPAVSYEASFREAIREAYVKLSIRSPPVIERPRSGQADLCLVTFSVAREAGLAPEEIAKKVMSIMGSDPRWTLEASGGYLNCLFDPKRFLKETGDLLWRNREHPCQRDPTGTKVIVEHTSANPNGPFHVGRARNPIIGDTLVRLLRLYGHDVEAQYWVNDMGKQVMILAWGIRNIPADELGEVARDKPDHRLVRYYQGANARMEADLEVENEINELLLNYEDAVSDGEWEKVISRKGRPEITASGIKEAIQGVLSGMTSSLSMLGVHIDTFIYESQVVEDHSLQSVIEGLRRSPLSREEDGALFLDLSDKIKGGDDDRFRRRFVYTRSDGSALYTTRDLAYHSWKLSRCDQAINVLGEDHRYQSQMLSLALAELGSSMIPEVVFYAFVSLPEGKMSTRRNRVVFLDDLLEEAVERAREEVLKRRDDLAEDELRRISEIVGIGALRFNVIKVQPEKRMVFKWEDALNFEGASAPFVQYSHARACSILKNRGSGFNGPPDWSLLVEPSEISLLRSLARFPQVIGEAASKRKMHLVPLYLVEMASSFNDFYRDCPVLSERDEGRRDARLALVVLSRNILRTGLDALGIIAPDQM